MYVDTVRINGEIAEERLAAAPSASRVRLGMRAGRRGSGDCAGDAAFKQQSSLGFKERVVHASSPR
jgi:hypothetical protein